MISVICVYNNKSILEEWLLKSLKSQTAKYELFLIDNTKNIVKSAAKVFNTMAAQASGNYLMFAHQDMDLISEKFLEKTEKILDNISRLGIAGVAGKSAEGFFPNEYMKTPTKVQTLDSCLVIIPKSVFDLVKFDEKTFNGWYMFIIDYCLTTKFLGYDTYVIPVDFNHKGSGYLPLKYFTSLPRLFMKHRQQKVVYTSVTDWNLSFRGLLGTLIKAPKYILDDLTHEQ